MDLMKNRKSSITYISGADAFLMGTIKKLNYSGVNIGADAFREITQLEEVNAPECSLIGDNTFYNCTGLRQLNAPNANKLHGVRNTAITSLFVPKAIITGEFNRNTSLTTAVIGSGEATYHSALTAVDYTAKSVATIGNLRDCPNLETVIIRGTHLATLSGTGNFTNTPFKSGGTGGTIYIPKVLYDQLGTGTNDYKTATNWSTVDGYGTITWAQIEGSQYEHYYADGTPIPTDSETEEPDDTTTVYTSSTGLSYTPTMTITLNNTTIDTELNKYGNMPYLKKLTITGVVKKESAGWITLNESTFNVSKYPSLKKLYIQPTEIRNSQGNVIPTTDSNYNKATMGHYVFRNTNLKELVIGKLNGPYWSGAGYFGAAVDMPSTIGSKDGMKLTVYTDAYSVSGGFLTNNISNSLAPTTELHCIDYLTGNELTS